MKKLFSLLLLLYTALLVSACTTTPYTRHKTPHISGTLYVNQKAAKDIPIYLSIKENDKYCRNPIQKTSTDSNGKFSLSSIKEKMSYTPLMTYYFDEWTLCAEVSGNRKTLYSDNRYEKGSVIQSINLKCEINNTYSRKKVCDKPLLSE